MKDIAIGSIISPQNMSGTDSGLLIEVTSNGSGSFEGREVAHLMDRKYLRLNGETLGGWHATVALVESDPQWVEVDEQSVIERILDMVRVLEKRGGEQLRCDESRIENYERAVLLRQLTTGAHPLLGLLRLWEPEATDDSYFHSELNAIIRDETL